MASNGLVANASKTSFVVLNLCKSDRDEAKINPLKVKIGPTTVTQEHSAKLLGITFNDKQNWSTQINGHGGVISSLNKRLFTIKRLKNHVNSKSLVKLVDGLFTSKINYGLQLYGKVRMFSSDKVTKDLKSVQKVQNKMARFLNGKTLKDKIQTQQLLQNVNLLSVNQLNAKIKSLEVWKALHIEDYPLQIPMQTTNINTVNTRAMSQCRPIENGTTILHSNSGVCDAIRLWNNAPSNIKSCTSIYMAKTLVKKFVQTLPI